MRLMLSEIAAAVHGNLIGEDRLIESIGIDTRTLKAGDLYVAIKGEHFDGHEFAAQAEQAGAAAVISERRLEVDMPQVIVTDTRVALAEMAGVWRRRLPVKVAGVTGSNGKTTVKEMIAAVLAVDDRVLYTQGNLNNDIGVPLTLLRLEPSHRYAVIEMGANHPGEIAYSSRYAKADVSVITNVGAAHIEGFGDLDGVAATKGEIIATLADEGVAVLNRGDAYYSYWLELAGARKTVSFGLRETADFWASDISTGVVDNRFVTRFELHDAGEQMAMQLQLAGAHNVMNALAAAAVCRQFGMTLAQIREGLARLLPVTGRLQPLLGKQGNVVIDDSYNANPASLKAALDVLVQLDGEPWLILGAFGELGESSAQLHREMGELCKAMKISRLFATGLDAEHCVEAFGEGGLFFDSQQQLITALRQQLTGNETLLIKGSRAQKMERVAAALVENFRA